MGQALYRKYRSKRLSEIVGQEHITATLDTALKQGRISHAYLFTGPRGVGKTSVARILAHEVNGLPYSDESYHLDIIEIDAASNRRIDEIRDLRDKVHAAPAAAPYKVYIIDEVHMLTKEAFNALLKTLEEPPAHVIFILATTEAHKLPETIISRTQRFTFKPISRDHALSHLRSIAEAEGYQVTDEALELLAEHGGGSFRDSISMLDQVSGADAKKITRELVEQIIGLAPDSLIDSLLTATLTGTPAAIIAELDTLTEYGVNPAQTARQLSAAVRNRLVEGGSTSQLLPFLERLLAVPAAPDPATGLELALLSTNLATAKDHPTKTPPEPVDTAPHPSPKPAAPAQTEQSKLPTNAKASPPKAAAAARPTKTKPSEAVPAVPQSSSDEALSRVDDWWPTVLQAVKQHNNTLYGVLRMAKPSASNGKINLAFSFGFHQKRINEAENQKKIKAAILDTTGQRMSISTTVEAGAPAAAAPPKSGHAAADITPDLGTITSVFGGAELLET